MERCLGTLLFKWGIYDKMDIIAEGKKLKIKLLGASPGIIFVILAACIFVFSLKEGLILEKYQNPERIHIKYSNKMHEVESFFAKWKDFKPEPSENKDSKSLEENDKSLKIILDEIKKINR